MYLIIQYILDHVKMKSLWSYF